MNAVARVAPVWDGRIVGEPQCDKAVAARFLTLLDETAEVFTFQTFSDAKPKPNPDPLAEILTGTLAELWVKLVVKNKRGAGVFVTINKTDKKGRKAENIVGVRAVWQEDDGEGKQLPLEPHIVVESSPGKFHRYLLCEGLSAEDHRRVENVLIADYGSDRSAADISRVLRVPGFLHRKGEPHLVRVIHESGAQPYCAAQVLAAFPPSASAQATPAANAGTATEHATPEQIRDLRSALAFMRSDARAEWITNGARLRGLGDVGRGLWVEYSQQSPKWQPSDAQVWDSLSCDHTGFRAVFKDAQARGWLNPMAKVARLDDLPSHVTSEPQSDAEPEGEDILAPTPVDDSEAIAGPPEPPTHLLTVPGAGELVDQINRTSPKLQPIFAVVTALAIGSTVAARRYKTTRNNYTSNYFLLVGKSGCGKEYARTVAEQVLADAGLENLIGPGGYTSEAAIVSSLIEQPAHLAILDEFGDLLKISSSASNHHKQGAMKLFKSIYGQFGGVLRPDGRSTLSMNKKQRSEIENKTVKRPALSLLGMTTPKSFYESLAENSIEGGFLNRINICETNVGRSVSRALLPEFVTPPSFIEWCNLTRQSGEGNLSAIDHGYDSIPPVRLIGIDDQSAKAFGMYAVASNESADKMEGEGLAELYTRCEEKALKIAAVLAVFVNPLEPVITRILASWAVDFVTFFTEQTVISIRRNMLGGKFSRLCADATRVVANSGRRGATDGELSHRSRALKELDKRQLSGVTDTLAMQGVIRKERIPTSGRGLPREAWVLCRPAVVE